MFWNGAPNQDRITVRNVTITGADLGIKAWQKISEFLAYDNTLAGNNLWTTAFIDTNITWNDDGINVAGSGNAVFNNTIKGFGDSLALDPQQLTTDSASVHFYRNEIISGGDDGFEADGGHRNITFYDNRLTNTMTMISLDPVVGGPLVAARNISINTGRSPLKMNNTNTGHFIYNNTIIRTNDKTGWGIAQPNNGYLRSWGYQNNILIYNNTNTAARLMAMEPATQNPIDFTHNSWYPDGSIWWSWSGGSYNNLATTYSRLPTTTPVFSGSTKRHEQDHILPNGNPWTSPVTLGSDYKTEVTQKYVPTLAPGTLPKNSGTVIPNITDGYTGSAPDRGAVISGRSLSVWGDRTGVVLPVSTPVVPVTPTTPVTPTVPVATPTSTTSIPSIPVPAPVSLVTSPSFVSQVAAIPVGTWGRITGDNTASDIDPEKDVATKGSYAGWTGYASVWEAWNSGAYAPNYGSCGSILYFGGGHMDYFGNQVIALNLCGGKQGGPIWERLSNPYTGTLTWPYENGSFPDGTPSPPHTYDGLAFDASSNSLVLINAQKLNTLATVAPTAWLFNLGTKKWSGPYTHKGSAEGVVAFDSKRNLTWFQPSQGRPGELTSFDTKTGTFQYYGWPYYYGLGSGSSLMGYDPVQDKLVLSSMQPFRLLAEKDLNNPSGAWKIVVQKNTPSEMNSQHTFAWSSQRQAWIVWNSYAGANVYELKRTGVNASGTPEYMWTLLTSSSNTVQPVVRATNGSYKKFQIVTVGGNEVLVGQLQLSGGIRAFRVPTSAQVPTTIITTTPSKTQFTGGGTKATLDSLLMQLKTLEVELKKMKR